ncbi:hypothetical protein DFA_01587 [Cavenderia fasciculata]|uniref:Major facilitator superfamily (MFS) profile domain-containing protein n=1 Tax=Cavenderia fasciculata TaxID=261658 RepID=F4PTN1_CACFS|nr:uncharacterized protein DFA_01587 [Cavenderia fasciculata]EGG21701.1 hypothetical protein DFA_01587 [Cavenderia fasciculata]|eukprot:XP_004359551.1 hypothetical protein DFA_01587 [Cavenderia fasciculata]
MDSYDTESNKSINRSHHDEERTSLINGGVDPEKNKPFRDRNLYNIIILGLSFCVVFTAFSPTQNLETTLNADVGFISLALLYASLSLSNFVSPIIVTKLGEKWALIAGMLTYATYIAANIAVTPLTLYLASAFLGFGGAILWTAESAFVIRCSTEATFGLHTGLFFALFQSNQIIGNLGMSGLLNSGASDRTLFIILTIVCGSSILFFLAIGNPSNESEKEKEEKKEPVPFMQNLLATVSILKELPIQLLIIALLYSGISQSYFFGVFPQLLGKEWLGYIMAVFGVFDAGGSVVFGRLSDKVGRKPIIIFASICTIGGSIFAYLIEHNISGNKVPYYFICAGLLGLSDAGYNTQLYALLGEIYPSGSKTTAAAAAFKFVQSIASAVAFFYGKYAVLYEHTLIINSLVIPSCILFIIVEYKFGNKNKSKIDQIE